MTDARNDVPTLAWEAEMYNKSERLSSKFPDRAIADPNFEHENRRVERVTALLRKKTSPKK